MDDREKIAAWPKGQGLGAGPLEDVSAIGGGTQNILLRFEHGGRPFVLYDGPTEVHKYAIARQVLRDPS